MPWSRLASYAAACCGVVCLTSCAKKDSGRLDTVPAAVAAPGPTTATAAGTMAPTSLSLADLVGTWKFRSVPQSGTDTTATEFTLTGAGDKWTQTYTTGLKVPMHVAVSGDSVITDASSHASVRRKGMQVTTHGVFRKEGDKLVGTTTAHYKTKGADSVLVLHTEGTRTP
jgi:hypothetical protein